LRELAALRLIARRRGIELPEPASRRYERFCERYRDDPVAFRHDIIRDSKDIPYQDEILAALVERKRAAVRSPHGVGKTAVAAWAVLWFVLTRPEDTKVVTTATAWRQLTKYLWPEMHKWAPKLRWDLVGLPPWQRDRQLLDLAIRHGPTCEAFAVACSDPDTIEGAHAANLLYVFDEAKGIPPATWDAAFGAFAYGDAYALAISTPGPPVGRFYEIHARKPGYERWWTRHVTLEEALAAGMVSPEWVEDCRKAWGEDSAVFRQRVLGEFAADEEAAVIPLALVEAAIERWRAWDAAGRPLEGKRVLGVDVARYGRDRSCIAERVGNVVVGLEKWGQADLMETTGRVRARLGDGVAHVDVIGLGAGVVDRLREQGCRVVGVNFAAKTEAADRSGELQFLNVRAAAWWGLRERLEAGEVALPPDDELIGDLVAPRYSYTSAGRLKVESKENVRARLGRSPDVGDAVVLAFWEPGLALEPALARVEFDPRELRRGSYGLARSRY